MFTVGSRKSATFLGLLVLFAPVGAQDPAFYPKLGTPSIHEPHKEGGGEKPRLPDLPIVPAVPSTSLGDNPVSSIQSVGGTTRRDGDESEMGFLIQLTPPGSQRLFRFESEETVRDRIRQEWKSIKKVEFPPSPEGIPGPLPPRIWPSLLAVAEPYYVCHKRLWFEQKNSERYGWDLGVLHPFVSAGAFYTDLALLPLNWASDPFRCFECNTGECLPGDPVPLMWYPILTK